VAPAETARRRSSKILLTISFCHLLNDTIQSLMPPIYPLLQKNLSFNYLASRSHRAHFSLTASILQLLVGLYNRPAPETHSLAVEWASPCSGLLAFSMAPSYGTISRCRGAGGIGSAVFHPESSRIARMAPATARHGAVAIAGRRQRRFRLLGSALAWRLSAGNPSIGLVSLLALVAIVLLTNIGTWFRASSAASPEADHRDPARACPWLLLRARTAMTFSKLAFTVAILGALMFSKFFYLASLMTYYNVLSHGQVPSPFRCAVGILPLSCCGRWGRISAAR